MFNFNKISKRLFLVLVVNVFFIFFVNAKSMRIFHTSFEDVSDFSNFYIVPRDYKNTCTHDLSSEQVHSGKYSHKAWIYASGLPGNIFVNNNHRAYPTIQLYKLNGGSFVTPCLITFYVWADFDLKDRRPINDWISFATLTINADDKWARCVLVNLDSKGFVHLMHVPNQGEQKLIFQTTTKKFPMRKWVQLKILIDMDSKNGYAKVWQDNELVSYAKVNGGDGKLAQAHFGLYAPPNLSKGVIYNDDLTIKELR